MKSVARASIFGFMRDVEGCFMEWAMGMKAGECQSWDREHHLSTKLYGAALF